MMFGRARLQIAASHLLLMALVLALVVGGSLLLIAQEARRTDDLELRLRAEGIALALLRGEAPVPPRFRDEEPGERDHDDHDRGLERQGILAYVLTVQDGHALPGPASGIAGLPSIPAADAALAEAGGRFTTLALDDGEVRVYSLPVWRDGEVVAVVQVARSRYFSNELIARLAVTTLALGLAGLLLSAGAGFWLAGRTLQPIAAALRRQREFTANASHELRTPLALIRGNAELLTRHPDRPIGEYLDVVQDIVDEGDRLGRLVADLLTLARADDGGPQLNLGPVDLSALGHALAREFSPLAAEKGLALHAEVQPGIVVEGDADRLRQLGVILLDNAVRYTAQGEVRLRVAREPGGALLVVSDTGPGIAPEHLPRIFERFYRADRARTSEGGGAGLGLAIARWIVEAHGGRIGVTSEVGRGSSFTVHLPHRVPARGMAWQAASVPSPPPDAS